MTLFTSLGFQPEKTAQMLAPLSIDYGDISVVIPVKNNQRGIDLFFSEFLKTHSPEHYPREILIVDNNSMPKITISPEYAKDGLEINVLLCTDIGPACARNLGVKHAQGTWILFTDSDCVASASFLRGYFQAIDGSLGYAGCVKSWGRDPLSRYYESQHILQPPVISEQDRHAPEYLVTANALVWKEALEYINGFNETIPIAAGEDIDLGFRLRAIGTLSFAPGACVYHNFNDGWIGFCRRFTRYGRGNKMISNFYALDLTPRPFAAKSPSLLNTFFARIQYLCLFWGYMRK